MHLFGKLFRKAKRILRKFIFKPNSKRIYDLVLKKDDARPFTKKALLAYIVHPFYISRDEPCFFNHINIWRAQEIVKVLNQLGYIVDVVDYTDKDFVPQRKYDLFLGHGGINFEKIAQHIPETATKIYFSTGCYWKFHNEQELARFEALRERRGVTLPPDRFIQNSEEGALLAAYGIIGIGNDFTRRTYERFSPVIMINGTSLFDDHCEKYDKDFDKGTEHFLYFAGNGPVHKGLDLLLEAFSGLKQHLWICSGLGQKFTEVYFDELHNHPNIHAVGCIPPRSAEFYELMNTCNYVILPSCSEGQAQSVVECMNQGLIPVVSRACGLDVDDYGVIIDPCTIEEIDRVVRRLSSYSATECKTMSKKARKSALSNFSEQAFSNNMKEAIRDLNAHVRSQEGVSSHSLILDPCFVDEHINLSGGIEAAKKLQSKNDRRYLQEEKGIIEVDRGRWEEAQRYERRSWMEGYGLNALDDRNREHQRAFENYTAIQGSFFNNAIEIGCGPFTNILHIQKHVRCVKITLLDPLINEYLTHPHCTYKRKRFGRWLGKKVETVAQPIEKFSSNEVYDLVVVINVLEHCFSTSQFFNRIISLTAPEGILVFHDKLIPAALIGKFVGNIYDSGHPLRVADNIILGWLSENYSEIFRKHKSIPTPIGAFDSIYFIGQKNKGDISR